MRLHLVDAGLCYRHRGLQGACLILCFLERTILRFSAAELFRDLTVQFVQVGLVDSAANLRQALIQPRFLLGVGLLNALLIGV